MKNATHSPKLNLVGHRFNRLTVLGLWERRFPASGGRPVYYWLCRCDCGLEVWQQLHNLKTGATKSCGCLREENNYRHGLAKSPTEKSWQHMLERCYKVNDPGYKNYGGRGIVVCECLRASPANLALLIGLKPADKTLHRVDNDGSYTCGACAECLQKGWPMNVEWATKFVQSQHKQNTLRVTVNGESKTLSEWARDWNVPRSLLHNRWYEGRPLLPLERRKTGPKKKVRDIS